MRIPANFCAAFVHIALPVVRGAVIDVQVGGPNGLLQFIPESVTGQAGDTVRFTITPGGNYSITESSLDNPCSRLPGGLSSVDFPPDLALVFPIVGTNAQWGYCEQHCRSGMVFAINPGPNQMAAFKAAALASGPGPGSLSVGPTASSPTGTRSNPTLPLPETSTNGETPRSTPTGSGPSDGPTDQGAKSNNTGPIVGGVVGGVGGLALLIAGWFFWKSRQRHHRNSGDAGTVTPSAATLKRPVERTPLQDSPHTAEPPPIAGTLSYNAEKMLPTAPHEATLPPSTGGFDPYAEVPAASSAPPTTSRATSPTTTLSGPASAQGNITAEQTDYIHRLYQANVPPQVVAGLIEKMMGGAAPSELPPVPATATTPNEEAVVGGKMLPPAYDSIKR